MATGVQIVFDCADPDQLANFWAAAFGYKKQDPPPGFDQLAGLAQGPGHPRE